MSSDNSSEIGIKKQCLRTRKQKESSIQNVPLRNTVNRKAKKRSLTNRQSSFNKVCIVEKEDQTLLKYFHKTSLSQNNLTEDSKEDLPNLNTVSSSKSVLQMKMCNVKVPLIPLEETELLDTHTLNMLRKNKISSTSLPHTKSTNVQLKNEQQITKIPIVTLKQIKVMDGQIKLNKLPISMPTATIEQTATVDIQIKKEKQDDIPITTLEETNAMDIENNQPNSNIPAASSEHTKSMDTQIKNEKQIKVAVVPLERAVTNIQTENNHQMINMPKISSKQTTIIDTEKENKKQNKVLEAFLEKPRVVDVHIKNNQQIINMPVTSSKQTIVKDIKIENEEQIKVPLVSLEKTTVPSIQAKNNQQIINTPITSSEQITVKNIKTENEEQVNIPLVSLEKITVPSVQGKNNQQNINMPISSSEYIEIEKIRQNNVPISILGKPRAMVAQIKNNKQITSMPVTLSKQTTVKNNQIENEKRMKFPSVSLEKKTIPNIQAENNQQIISMAVASSKHTEVLMGFNHNVIENKKLNNIPVASLEKSIAMDVQIENENQKKVPVISSEKTKIVNIQKESNQQKFNVIPNLKVSVSSLKQDKSPNTHFPRHEKVSIIPSVAMQNTNLKMADFSPKILAVNPNVTLAVLGTSGSHSNIITNQIPTTNSTSNTSILKQQNIINTVSAPKINFCNISNNPLPQQLFEIKCPIIEVPKLITGSNNSTSTSNVSRIICMPVNEVSNVLQTPIVELPNMVPNTAIKMQQINVLNNSMSTVGGFIKLSPNSISSENISQGLPTPIKIYHTSPYSVQPPITSAATKNVLLNSEFLCNNVVSEKHQIPFKQTSSIYDKNNKVTNLNKQQKINFSSVCNSNNINHIPTARKVIIPLYQQDGKVSNKQTPNNSVQNKNLSQYVILDHNYASSISLLNEKTGVSKIYTKGKVLQDADQTETSSSESDTSFDDDIYDDDFFHMMEPEVILLEGKGTFFLTKGGDLKYLKPFQPMYSRQKPFKNINKTNQINKKTIKINKFNSDNSSNDDKDTITGIIVPKKTYQRKFNAKPLQQKFVFRNGEVASSLLQSCFVWLDRMNKDVLENGVVNLAETPIEKLFLLDNRILGNEYSSKCKSTKNETLKQTEEIRKINKSELTKMKSVNSPKKESNQPNPVSKMADVLRLLQDRRKALEALRHKRKLFHKPTFNINHQNHNSEHM